MDTFFYKLYTNFKSRKLIVISFLICLVCILLFFSSRLNLEEDISKLIPQTEETKTLNEVLKNTNFADKIIVNISVKANGSPDDLTAFASEIIDSLQLQCKDYIKKIQGEIEDEDVVKTIDFIYDNLPLFLDESDYQFINQKLSNDSLNAVIQSNYKTLISPSGLIAKKTIRKDPFGLLFRALEKLEAIKISDNFEIYNGFLITENKKNILLFIDPKLPTNETEFNTIFVEKLYKISEGLNVKYANKVTSEYYGSTVVAVSNANQIKKDIKYTISIALTVLILVLIFFYKRISIPILLFIPTLLGALVAIVSLHFIRESISAISLGIGSVLLGITLDYSLHILTHYRNNNDVKQLYKDVTKPILMSSITTGIAFLCLLLLKSQALQDLGLFAALSVFSTSIIALILIPLFFRPKLKENIIRKNSIEKVASYRYDKNKILIGACLLLLMVSFFTSKKVNFNEDLNSMNYRSEITIEAENNLDSIWNISAKSVYLVAYGNDMENVLEANQRIADALKKYKESNEIIQFSSTGSIVLSQKEQNDRLELWNSFWTDSLKLKLKTSLINDGVKVGFKESTYNPFYKLIDQRFSRISLNQYAEIGALMMDEYISDADTLKTAVSIIKMNETQIAGLEKIVNEIPDTMLIDRKHISESFLGALKDDFSKLIWYSFIAVFLILFLFYKNIALTLLTATPIALSWLFTLGIMGLFGIEFTIFNVIISTFIFGLGVDYSIFITNALVKDYTYNSQEITTYKTSIVLSVITTILGVGVLILAKHPALKSIAAICLIGISITGIVVFVMQPLIFRLFVTNRAKQGFSPIKIRLFFYSIFLSLFYGLGGILLSIFSVSIFQIIPISKKRKYRSLNKTAALLVRSVLYLNLFVKKKVINDVGEKFEKPAIIISNHSSALDTLTMGLLTHNIIYLVNDWVYKSPIFGILAKVLGFYPISNGVDNSTEHLREKVNQGYSLVVFPEGKRSFSNKIGRFHKGAFFLQEELKLDLLPVYFHGNSEVMPKGDFIIYDGSLTVEVGKRISYNDLSYGLTSRERNKKISKKYKEEFLKIRNKLELKDYFQNILMSNYIYKDPEILKEINKDFLLNIKTYHLLNTTLPYMSKILHIANDFGQIDILVVAKSLDRKITTLLKNDSKREIAKNCYTNVLKKVNYVANIDSLDLNSFEILLLTNPDSAELIEKMEIANFNQIIILNNVFPLKNLLELGYSPTLQKENIVFLKKNN